MAKKKSRKLYHRQYKREQRARQKAEAEAKSEVVEKTENMDKEMTGDLMDLAKDIFKDKDGKPTKQLVFIERGMKYLPILGKFAQGFLSNAQQFVPQQRQQSNVVSAPVGWIGMSPLERLKRKLDGEGNVSAWYSQGMAYEKTIMGSEVNVNYVDPNYDPRRTRQAIPVPEERPSSLQELKNKYPEAPLVSETEEIKNTEDVKETMDKAEQITNVLQEDAKKYVFMGIEHINKLSPQEFEVMLDTPDKLFDKFKRFKFFIPVHLKEFILNTPSDHITLILKENCAEQYKIVEEKKKEKTIEELFDKIKKELSE